VLRLYGLGVNRTRKLFGPDTAAMAGSRVEDEKFNNHRENVTQGRVWCSHYPAMIVVEPTSAYG